MDAVLAGPFISHRSESAMAKTRARVERRVVPGAVALPIPSQSARQRRAAPAPLEDAVARRTSTSRELGCGHQTARATMRLDEGSLVAVSHPCFRGLLLVAIGGLRRHLEGTAPLSGRSEPALTPALVCRGCQRNGDVHSP